MNRAVQFSVFLVNKPGVLSQIFRELARAKINITNVAMMDSTEHGVLRMTVDDPGTARAVFRGLNVPVSENEVLVVTLPNRPGAAAELCERLSAAHINIGYMYCTSSNGTKTLVVIKVPDIKKAVKVLESSPKSPRRDMRVKLRRPTTTSRK